jgi:hypothetical protein
MNDLRQDMILKTANPQNAVFKFDRVTDDLPGFKGRIQIDKDERAKAVG